MSISRAAWLEAIEAATEEAVADGRRKPTKHEIVRTLQRLFPEECAMAAAAAEQRGFLRDLSDVMRSMGGHEEEGGVDSQLAILLPGPPPPAYITAPDPDGGLTVVKYINAVRPERLAAINERKRVAERIANRAADLEKKEFALAPYTTDEHTTTAQALERMKRDGEQAA